MVGVEVTRRHRLGVDLDEAHPDQRVAAAQVIVSAQRAGAEASRWTGPRPRPTCTARAARTTSSTPRPGRNHAIVEHGKPCDCNRHCTRPLPLGGGFEGPTSIAANPSKARCKRDTNVGIGTLKHTHSGAAFCGPRQPQKSLSANDGTDLHHAFSCRACRFASAARSLGHSHRR